MRYWRLALFILSSLLLAVMILELVAPSIALQKESSGKETVIRINNRGAALMDQFKYQEAAREFELIIEMDPEFVPASVNLGIARFYLQEYEKASAALQQALQRDPKQVHAHYMLGLIYRNQDLAEEAIAEFEKVAQQDSDDPSTNYFLGLLHSRQKDYQRAGDYLRRVISLEPYNASAHYNLAIALLRSGQTEAGQKEMEEFKRLQNLFGSTTVGLQYLEQGKYATVIDHVPAGYLSAVGDRPTEQPPGVTFTEIAEEAGLTFRHDGPGTIDFHFSSPNDLEGKAVPFLGSGVAAGDFDSDGWVDLFFANAGAEDSRGALFRNQGNGRFREITADAGITFAGPSMMGLWGDVNNDGHLDLYLVNFGANVLYQNNQDGTFTDVTNQAGVGDTSWGMGGAFVDYDHDGDLDIYVVNFIDHAQPHEGEVRFPDDFSGVPNVLYRNNGNGTFTDTSSESGLDGGKRKSLAVMATDFDSSRDIDFYVVHYDSSSQLFSNQRDGTFKNVAEATGVAGERGIGIAVGDFNRDTRMDLFQPTPAILLDQQQLRKFRKAAVSSLSDARPHVSQFLDFDNDGDLDLLVAAAPLFESPAPTGSRQTFYLLANHQGNFHDVSNEAGLARFSSLPVRGLSIADFDNDGDLDLAASVNGGRPLLLRNDGGNRNHWLTVDPRGTNSNKWGVGTKIELKSGSLLQKQEIYGGHGFLSQSPTAAHFGLGMREQVDVLRLLWPGGVLQSEIGSPINQRVPINELDRKGTSCPILYTWNGHNYEFLTDFLGGSAYGYLLAPGVYNYPDTDEYVKLDPEQLALRDGHVAVTLNNQLEEVILFDQLELVVVDHPEELDVFADEKLLPGPPYQDFRLLTASSSRAPLKARDSGGRTVLPEISRVDRLYPDLFRKLPFKGYAEEHELILDLGARQSEREFLLMHAWIDYADSTSNLAAAQAGEKLIPPYLQVRNPQGEWVTVIERMGFPAGLPKTMTVDLTGKFLSDSRKSGL